MLDAAPRTGTLTIRGGLCLLPGQGLVPADLVCESGLIAGIESRAAAQPSGIDATGCLVLPGLIDIHGDAFERQIMPRPKTMFPVDLAMRETDSQLVANGITTAFHGVTVSWEPGLRSLANAQALVSTLQSLAPAFKADNRLHIRWETFALDEREAVKRMLREMPGSVLAFNDHTGVERTPAKRAEMIAKSADRALVPASEYDRPHSAAEARHAEVPDAIAEMAAFARAHGIAMLSHDDMSAEQRSTFRALGATACEFPTTADARDAAAAAGDPIIMGAPNVVRGGSHLGAIGAEESIRLGRCTVLASDYYYPALLAAALGLWRRNVLSLEQAWSLVSSAPARAAGLADRGQIASGQRADLVIIPHHGHLSVATIVAGRAVWRSC